MDETLLGDRMNKNGKRRRGPKRPDFTVLRDEGGVNPMMPPKPKPIEPVVSGRIIRARRDRDIVRDNDRVDFLHEVESVTNANMRGVQVRHLQH